MISAVSDAYGKNSCVIYIKYTDITTCVYREDFVNYEEVEKRRYKIELFVFLSGNSDRSLRKSRIPAGQMDDFLRKICLFS